MGSDVIEPARVTAIIDRREPTEGPVGECIGSDRPRTIRPGPVQARGVHARLGLFSPSLAPGLARGTGPDHAVGAPPVPTRRAVGPTGFAPDADRQLEHPVGILPARRGQSREVSAQVLAPLRPGRLCIGHTQSPRPPPIEIPHLLPGPMRRLVPRGRGTTTRARVPEVVATVGDARGRWQVCGCGDLGAGVGSVRPWTAPRVALRAQRFGPALLR
jgi:hypothetical protein